MSTDEYYSDYSSSVEFHPPASVKRSPAPPSVSQSRGISRPVRPIPTTRRPVPSPNKRVQSPQVNTRSTTFKTPSPLKKQIQIPAESDSYYSEEESEGSDSKEAQKPQQPIPASNSEKNVISPSTAKYQPEAKAIQPDDSSDSENKYVFHDTNKEPPIFNGDQLKNPQRAIPSKETIEFDLRPKKPLEKPSNEKVYRVTRTKTKLSSYTFRLYCREQCLMIGVSSNIKKYVEIKKGEVISANDQLDGYISISHKKRNFVLKKEKKDTNEIMNVKVSSVSTPIFYDRFFNVSLKNDSENGEEIVELKSMMPKRRPDGKYTMSFGGKFTKKSIKNAVLINDIQQKIIVVRKIGDGQLEIVANTIINDPIQVFAFGIISWICPY